MDPYNPVLDLVRQQLGAILVGTVFSFIGLSACLIAVFRRRGEFRLLVWFALFIGMYGARMLAHATTVLQLAPQSRWPFRMETTVYYLLVIPALLFWAELSKGYLRQLIYALAVAASVIAAVGLVWFALGGSPQAFVKYNLLIAVGAMFIISVLIPFPTLFGKYIVIRSRVLRVVMPLNAVLVLFFDLGYLFGFPPPPYAEPAGFALWIAAIGYEAAKHTFDKERRLLSIESELETARQIQSSILPAQAPSVPGLRIAVSYNPMSAVAGDFYQFLEIDGRRIGILVADVTGHGVPAALIASMIKVAMQSAAAFASDPGQVLRTLNRILTPELNGRLISAAYLWIDPATRLARYSAAGHPPLLLWKDTDRRLLRIESNSLLFGVLNDLEYPVGNLALQPGDRILLYTDGLIEPESARGEPFGDHQLESVVAAHQGLTAHELSRHLLSAVRSWQAASIERIEDDITLIAIDVLETEPDTLATSMFRHQSEVDSIKDARPSLRKLTSHT